MLTTALLCYVGFTALCLSMEKHYLELIGRPPKPQVLPSLRVFGWLMLALSVLPSVHKQGWAMGLVNVGAVWIASAVFLVWLIPYGPKWALRLAAVGLVVAPLTTLI